MKAGRWLLPVWVVGLGACGDQGVAPVTQTATADSADQVLERMTTTIVGEGVRRSVVYADTAYVYQDRQTADLRGVTANFFDPQGNQTSVLTSRSAIYQFSSGTMEAWGGVVVRSTDGTNRKLETEHLLYDPLQNLVKSDSAFVFTSPAEVLRGRSFRSDPAFQNFVTASPRGRQRGEGVRLPGQ